LSTRIEAQTLAAKSQRASLLQLVPGHEFAHPRLANRQRQTGVAAYDRVAYAVAFALVEEQYLVGLSDSIVIAEVTDIGTAVGEY
jgi:hypothetical protein